MGHDISNVALHGHLMCAHRTTRYANMNSASCEYSRVTARTCARIDIDKCV